MFYALSLLRFDDALTDCLVAIDLDPHVVQNLSHCCAVPACDLLSFLALVGALTTRKNTMAGLLSVIHPKEI